MFKLQIGFGFVNNEYIYGYDVFFKVGFGVFCIKCCVCYILINGLLRLVYGWVQRGVLDRVQVFVVIVVLEKNIYMYYGKKGLNIVWLRKMEIVWMGGCFDGFIFFWFLFNVYLLVYFNLDIM